VEGEEGEDKEPEAGAKGGRADPLTDTATAAAAVPCGGPLRQPLRRRTVRRGAIHGRQPRGARRAVPPT
jgi:hypothetical protein